MNTRIRTLCICVALLLIAALAWMLLPFGDAAPPVGMPSQPRDEGTPATAANEPAQRFAVDVPTPASTRTLQGRLLEPYGEPVGNALVGDASSSTPVHTATDGRFELRVGADTAAMTLLLLARGHAPMLLPLDLQGAAAGGDLGDIVLRHAGSIRGTVAAAGGQPVPGAVVMLHLQSNVAPAGFDFDKLLAPARTDGSGGYAFAALMPGSYRVAVDMPGMQRSQSASIVVREGEETAVAPIVLAIGYELVGVVVDAGDAPVAGAAVRIQNGNNQSRFRSAVQSGADGSFAATALPPGPLRIEVTKPGFLPTRIEADASRGERLVVRLEAGLGIRGTAVDARTGRAVPRFAAMVRRVGDLDPASNGTMEQQLLRQVELLRTAAAAGDAAASQQQLDVAAQFESRLVALRQAAALPVAVPKDLGPELERPQGRFAFDGLEEGLYIVGIAASDHRYVETAPIELHRGTIAAELRVELPTGMRVSGVVVANRSGRPVAAARVELSRVTADARPPIAAPSPTAWAFAKAGPAATVVMTTSSGSDGRFEFAQVAAGACLLTVRQPQFADLDSEVFFVQGDGIELRLGVDERASLSGRVRNLQAMQVEVLVLGGHGTLRTATAAADGSYRFDLLQPGSYLVRAFPTDARQYKERLLGAVFATGPQPVDPARLPQCDVTLAAGERKVFDLDLDQPAAGIVAGTSSINGEPGRGSRIVLQPVPGEAPGSGGLSLRGSCDDLGQFRIADVPAGNYSAQLFGATRQELHREAVHVEPGTIATLHIFAAAGAVRGRILAPGAQPAELRGYVWVLPGADAAPDDLYDYRREHRTHRIAVQAGAFADAALTPGPAVVVADIRGQRRVVTTVVVPAAGVLAFDLTMAGRGP